MSDFEIFWTRFTSPGHFKNFLTGLQNTAIIAVFGFTIGLILGCILSTILIIPKKNLIVTVLKRIIDVYVAVFRGTPMVVQLLLFHFAIFRAVIIPPVIEASLIFGLNSSAYMTEIIRGGINSVDKGQLEAGRSVGLSFTTTMVRVVIPQAIKNVIPSLGNELISLLKETSIVSFIAILDLTKAFRNIAESTYEYFVPYIGLAVVYLVAVIILTIIIKLIERRLRKSEKK
ncbi:MAG: amino acid ABC transporter permease [Clostridiales bacterium]|nr:amino acid ABC transporter permease [Clostridiales bacterium]